MKELWTFRKVTRGNKYFYDIENVAKCVNIATCLKILQIQHRSNLNLNGVFLPTPVVGRTVLTSDMLDSMPWA